jgi:hypothetical protein
MSGRVLPVTTSDNFDEEPSTHKETTTCLTTTQEFFLSYFYYFQQLLTWENARQLILWFLDTATLKLSLSVSSLLLFHSLHHSSLHPAAHSSMT